MKLREKLPRREGYWWSKYSPLLPKPVANDKPWKGRKVFLAALKKKQGKAQQDHFKGFSTCRCCGSKRNGTAEYRLDGWVWPEGFIHYVKEHNVRPSLAFQEFVVGPIEDRD